MYFCWYSWTVTIVWVRNDGLDQVMHGGRNVQIQKIHRKQYGQDLALILEWEMREKSPQTIYNSVSLISAKDKDF